MFQRQGLRWYIQRNLSWHLSPFLQSELNMLIHKLTIALTVASGAAMLASSCRAETARERREKLFKADQEVLIREHQIGLELFDHANRFDAVRGCIQNLDFREVFQQVGEFFTGKVLVVNNQG